MTKFGVSAQLSMATEWIQTPPGCGINRAGEGAGGWRGETGWRKEDTQVLLQGKHSVTSEIGTGEGISREMPRFKFAKINRK